MSNRKAIVFEYRWWRIKQGLSYKVIEHLPYLHDFDMTEGSYLYIDAAWYYRGRRIQKRQRPSLVTMSVMAYEVPKEIRTTALLLT